MSEQWEITCDAHGCTDSECVTRNAEWVVRSQFRAMGWRIICAPNGGFITYCPVHYHLGEQAHRNLHPESVIRYG